MSNKMKIIIKIIDVTCQQKLRIFLLKIQDWVAQTLIKFYLKYT